MPTKSAVFRTATAQISRLIRQPLLFIVGFALVHIFLIVAATVNYPGMSLGDINLYAWWWQTGLYHGEWPVADFAWVYPAGAMVPIAAVGAPASALNLSFVSVWLLFITLLNALAAWRVWISHPRGPLGAWWWLIFLAALGPIALCRLDSVAAPIAIIGLVTALNHPAIASAILTFGAWVKIAPGVLFLPLFTFARRWRTTVVPAAAVCGAVVVAVIAVGGLEHFTSFLSLQDTRGLQIEATAATPWMLATMWSDEFYMYYNDDLSTWEVTGPGVGVALNALDIALPIGVGLVGVFLVRRRLQGTAAHNPQLLGWAGAVLTIWLIVSNKVGSPQFITWLAAPTVLVVLVYGLGGVRQQLLPLLMITIAALTHLVCPIFYGYLMNGEPFAHLLLALRNVLVVVALVLCVRRLGRTGRNTVSAPASQLAQLG